MNISSIQKRKFLGNIYKQLKDSRADEYIKKAIELDTTLSARVQN